MFLLSFILNFTLWMLLILYFLHTRGLPLHSAVTVSLFISITGEGAGAGTADKRTSTGQLAAVHSADRYQGHRAACSAYRRELQRYRHMNTSTHPHGVCDLHDVMTLLKSYIHIHCGRGFVVYFNVYGHSATLLSSCNMSG